MLVQYELNTGQRIGSMLLDHIIMCAVAMIFLIPSMLIGIGSIVETTPTHTSAEFLGPWIYIALCGFVTYFCKDVVNGRSIGKRITNLQVVDDKTGEVATPMQCFVRNIFCIIWPAEVIITFFNPQKRIGDLVAGTRVVVYNPLVTVQPKPEIRKILVPVAISYVLLLLIFLLIY
jgi:uncharacterized RDD family membrane protein YckC